MAAATATALAKRPRAEAQAQAPATAESQDVLSRDEECARRLQQEFDQEAASKAVRTQFRCPLCLETSSFDDSVELDCLHRLCCECFSQYIELKIREKRVTEEELCCPMPSCNCEVTVLQVQGNTKGTPLWDRFLAARAELWRPGAEDGQLCACPNPRCAARFLVEGHWTQVRCPQCHARFCPRCRLEHPGVSCEAYGACRKENDTIEREFERLVQRQRWQRCPCCTAPCERSHGCNFMTCYSANCRGKKSFCYLCGEELNAVQHITHFPHGPFENVCERVDRRGDASLPKAQFFEEAQVRWWTNMVDEMKGWMWGKEDSSL